MSADCLKIVFAILFALAPAVVGAAEGESAAAVAETSSSLPPEVTNDGAATTEVLLRTISSWDGVSYETYPAGQPELTLVRIVIPSNTALHWHTHPMPNVAYVVRGELTVVQHGTGLRRKLIGGQTLPEMVDTVHRGYSGAEPVELLVFYAGSPGMPLSKPADIE